MGWIGREALGLFRPSLADVFVYGDLPFYGQVMRKTDKALHWHVGSLGILPLGASASDFCRFLSSPTTAGWGAKRRLLSSGWPWMPRKKSRPGTSAASATPVSAVVALTVSPRCSSTGIRSGLRW